MQKKNTITCKHYLVVLACAPNCIDEYRAICGYTSTKPKDFTSVSNPSSAGVTCEACLKKLGKSVVIVKEKVTGS